MKTLKFSYNGDTVGVKVPDKADLATALDRAITTLELKPGGVWTVRDDDNNEVEATTKVKLFPNGSAFTLHAPPEPVPPPKRAARATQPEPVTPPVVAQPPEPVTPPVVAQPEPPPTPAARAEPVVVIPAPPAPRSNKIHGVERPAVPAWASKWYR